MYGSNGSGKTNIVAAMLIYTGLVLGSVQASNSAFLANYENPKLHQKGSFAQFLIGNTFPTLK